MFAVTETRIHGVHGIAMRCLLVPTFDAICPEWWILPVLPGFPSGMSMNPAACKTISGCTDSDCLCQQKTLFISSSPCII